VAEVGRPSIPILSRSNRWKPPSPGRRAPRPISKSAIADVERVLGAANKSIQTLLLALPASLAPQLLGLEDHNKIFAVIDRGVKATLSNLASIDAILQAKRVSGDEDE
jgi:hypothetical protein